MPTRAHRAWDFRFLAILFSTCLLVWNSKIRAACADIDANVVGDSGDSFLTGYLEDRVKEGLSWQDDQILFRNLLAASGVCFAPSSKYFSRSSLDCSDSGKPMLAGYTNIHVESDTPAPLLRELAKAFQDGFGCTRDFKLALALFRLASDGGDPEAQGQMGLRFATGLHTAESWDESGIRAFGETSDASTRPDNIPQLDKLRLSSQASNNGQLNTERQKEIVQYYQNSADQGSGTGSVCGWSGVDVKETVQYYQNSADQGSAQAQSMVGQVMNAGTYGVQRDHTQALHYLKMAAEADDVDAMTHLGHMYANGMARRNAVGGKGRMYANGMARRDAAASKGRMYANGMARRDAAASKPQKATPKWLRFGVAPEDDGDAWGGWPRDKATPKWLPFGLAPQDNGDAWGGWPRDVSESEEESEQGRQQAEDMRTAKKWFDAAAAKGSAGAQFALGNIYLTGRGAPLDYDAAFKMFSKFALGNIYLTGRGVPLDYDTAFKMFSKSAEQGHPEAHFFLGLMHLKGWGVKRKSAQMAYSYFNLASRTGHKLAMYNLALMNLAGTGTVKNCKPGATGLKSLAERGPAAAMLQVAQDAYFQSDYQYAIFNYLMASEAGIELGQANIAWMLEKGYSRQGDQLTNITFLYTMRSAEKGNVASLMQFGGGYLTNITFLYTMRSAEQGNVASLMGMGDSFLYGNSVPQDWVRSSAIYYEAYQERSAEAMFNLGYAHEFGVGVQMDLKLARRFYDMAMHSQSNAAAAVYIARGWLGVHQAWVNLRPYFPKSLDVYLDKVFVLEAPYTTVFGGWANSWTSGLPTQILFDVEKQFWQWVGKLEMQWNMNSGGGGGAGAGGEGDGEFPEVPALICLLVILYMVMWVRQQRAARLRERHERERAENPSLGQNPYVDEAGLLEHHERERAEVVDAMRQQGGPVGAVPAAGQ
eukprot:gene7836-1036_t